MHGHMNVKFYGLKFSILREFKKTCRARILLIDTPVFKKQKRVRFLLYGIKCCTQG